MGRYVRKPVEVDAWQWTPPTFAEHMPNWLLEAMDKKIIIRTDLDNETDGPMEIIIRTLEGDVRASEGDWIIRDAGRRIYPCKPEAFAAAYCPAVPLMASFPPGMEAELTELMKAPGNITYLPDGRSPLELAVGEVEEVDPKTHPRGEPLAEMLTIDDLHPGNIRIRLERLAKDIGACLLHLEEAIMTERAHTAAAQAKIEELEEHLRDCAREANISDRSD